MAGGTVGGRHAAGRVRVSNVPLAGFGQETETFGDGWKSVKDRRKENRLSDAFIFLIQAH